MWINLIKRKIDKSQWAISIIVMFMVFMSLNRRLWTKKDAVIYWDAISYYAYLPASFIYQDLSLKFTDDYHGKHKFIFWPEKTPSGRKCIKTSMGLAILLLPFFLFGHLWALFTHFDAGGFSVPYQIALVVASDFWFFTGLFVLRKLLLKFFSDTITAFTLLLIALGSNLFYYTLFEPVMPHQYNFALFAIFLYLSILWYDKPDVKKSIGIGICIGLISLVRPTDLLISIFFLFYGITKFGDIPKQLKYWLKNYKFILILAFTAFLIWIPQMIYWKYISGHFLYFSYNGERFFWNHPHLLEGYFGYRKGWLLYTPLMVFALIGILFLRKKLNSFLVAILIFVPLNSYVILSWWAWWYGGSFGLRPMIESYSLLSIPLAAFLVYISKQKKFQKYILIFVILLFASYNIFATFQYKNNAIHYDGMTKEAYWESFGHLHPSGKFWKLLKQPDYEAAKRGEE